MNEKMDPFESYKAGALTLGDLAQVLWVSLRDNPDSAHELLLRLETLQSQGVLEAGHYRELKSMTETLVKSTLPLTDDSGEASGKKTTAIERQKARYKAALGTLEPSAKATDEPAFNGRGVKRRTETRQGNMAVRQGQSVRQERKAKNQARKESVVDLGYDHENDSQEALVDSQPQQVSPCTQTDDAVKTPIEMARDGIVVPKIDTNALTLGEPFGVKKIGSESRTLKTFKAPRQSKEMAISAIPADLVSVPLTLHATDRPRSVKSAEESTTQNVKADQKTGFGKRKFVKWFLTGSVVALIAGGLVQAFAPGSGQGWLIEAKPLVEQLSRIVHHLFERSSDASGAPAEHQRVGKKESSSGQRPNSANLVVEQKAVPDTVGQSTRRYEATDTAAMSSEVMLSKIRLALSQQLIEPESQDGTALFWLKQMSVAFVGEIRLQEARALIAEAYLEQARRARQEKAWSEAVTLVSKALRIRSQDED